ncbi:MAG: glycosyltransferase family 4 protein [Ignavibacteriaceae bacterium]
MKILLLAPHPFYQERGTPIDVYLVLRVLSERADTKVDLLVYNEGTDIELPGLNIFRIPNLKYFRNIRPGFSFKKLVADFFMFISAWKMVIKNRYDYVHAGEEAVFFAMLFKSLFRIPYIYDLDSSIAQQIVEKKPFLRFLAPVFNYLEKMAIVHAEINLPVCNALAELCEKQGSQKTFTIHDISQLKNPGASSKGFLKKDLNINNDILMYIGNLESYQGIDLLLKSFSEACKKTDKIDLVIIGGNQQDIKSYKEKSSKLKIENRVHFLGPRPFNQLDEYLAEADIIACPRIRGVNTPMKIFPYLHSGKPVIATDLYTHNQILTDKEAYLAPANAEGFSKAIVDLSESKELRKKYGENGQEFVEKNHTYKAHKERLNNAYNWLKKNNRKLNKVA